jgi:hypothetical protein
VKNKLPSMKEVEDFGADDLFTPEELMWYRRGHTRGVVGGIVVGMAFMQLFITVLNHFYGN